MSRRTALRALLAVVFLAHLVLGLIGFVSLPGPLTATVESAYGASVDLTPQLQHVVRVLGAFMLAVAFLAAAAWRDPERNRAVVLGVVVLLVLRATQRLVFADDVHEAFGLSYARLWSQAIFFYALAAALFVLRPKPEA